MSTGNKCNGFFIVHGHTCKCLADVTCGKHGIWVSVRAFRVDVDQTHLHCSKWVIELTVTLVALITEPCCFFAPVGFICFVHICTSATESEGLKAHRVECNVASKNEQVCPRQLVAVLLLHWPQQATCFVEVAVVWPRVQWSKALHAGSAATATVLNSVCTSSVPGHTNKEWSVMAVVGWPPVL